AGPLVSHSAARSCKKASEILLRLPFMRPPVLARPGKNGLPILMRHHLRAAGFSSCLPPGKLPTVARWPTIFFRLPYILRSALGSYDFINSELSSRSTPRSPRFQPVASLPLDFFICFCLLQLILNRARGRVRRLNIFGSQRVLRTFVLLKQQTKN